MNVYKLKWGWLIVVLIVVDLIVGCTGPAVPTDTPEPQATTVNVVVNSAENAVVEAKKYAGITLNVVWEEGLQAEDPKTFGPRWEALTGIKINVVEIPNTEMYARQMDNHTQKAGEFDVLTFTPSWVVDFTNAGVLEPLNPYMDQYLNKADLDDFLPFYAEEGYARLGDTWYGFPDDGDMFVLYYRKDLFEDETNRSEFKAKHGYDLQPPVTLHQFNEIGSFFTDKYAPDLYGGAIQRSEQLFHWFYGPFSGAGGQFFDPQTMKPGINSAAGLEVMTQLAQTNAWMPPDVATYDIVKVLEDWMAGKLVMMITWPPFGRWSEGVGLTTEQLSWVPETQVAGKVGYALPPGARHIQAGGFALGVASDSPNKEAAYLFIQWMNSPEISLQRVMLPYALRDPFRKSHFESPLYLSLWPSAPEYLKALREATVTGQYELGVPGANEYNLAVDAALAAVYAGADPQTALDQAAAKWEQITDSLGRDKQQQEYQRWLQGEWNQPGPKQ